MQVNQEVKRSIVFDEYFRCRICGEKLVKFENWSKSHIGRNDKICNTCFDIRKKAKKNGESIETGVYRKQVATNYDELKDLVYDLLKQMGTMSSNAIVEVLKSTNKLGKFMKNKLNATRLGSVLTRDKKRFCKEYNSSKGCNEWSAI
jgi:hypothetical protein